MKLHCDLGLELLVMLPTGELTMVPRPQTSPTDKPFVAADEAAMKTALTAAGFGKFKMVSAPPYLFVYASSEGFYLHTRSILETMYPGVKATLTSWGLEPAEPAVPLVVIIMPSRAEFDAYDETSPEIAAYYNTLTNYVVLYEDQKLWEAARNSPSSKAHTSSRTRACTRFWRMPASSSDLPAGRCGFARECPNTFAR